MAAVDVVAGFAKEAVDVLDSLAAVDVFVDVFVVFLDAYLSGTGYGDVFVPVDGNAVYSSVSSPAFLIVDTRYGLESVGMDCDGRLTVGIRGVFSFEDTVGCTFRMFEVGLTPIVCQGFMLPKRAVSGHFVAVYGVVRPDLLIHRDA